MLTSVNMNRPVKVAGRERQIAASRILVVLLAAALLPLAAVGAARAEMSWGEAYGGVFLGAGLTENRIVDPSGFGNWGTPGWATDYDGADAVGGLLLGTKVDLNGARFRIEVDGIFGDMAAKSDRVDPVGRDETARASVRWAATARLGLEHRQGPVTIFINGGAAVARITNSLTDIDFNAARNIPPHVDPDDSFSHGATRVGWVLGLGIEAPVWDSWKWRLDGSYLGFGRSTRYVNRSGNNPCGPGGPRAACPYRIENHLVVIRLALVRRFDLLR